MQLITKLHSEISYLKKEIDTFVENYGIDYSVDRLRNYLDLPSSENGKLEYCIKNAAFTQAICDQDRHDILCCIAKGLGIQNIPQDSIYSQGDLIEFDPAKNGKNILKHGVSFLEIISYMNTDKGAVISYTKTKNGEERKVWFLKVHNKNALVVIATKELSQEEYRQNERINTICEEELAQEPIDKNASSEIIREEILKKTKKIISILKSEGVDPPVKPERFISARYFGNNDSDIEKAVNETIKDENLDEQAICEFRKGISELLKQYL